MYYKNEKMTLHATRPLKKKVSRPSKRSIFNI